MSYKVFLSPTKNINSLPFRYEVVSNPYFRKEAKYLVDQLKKKKLSELVELMHISEELAKLTYERFNKWKMNPEDALSFHAIEMYAGEAFKAFDFQSIESNNYTKLQNNLFILSGLYGILKPFDIVSPYRLEIGLSFAPSAEKKNLYAFWQEKIHKYLMSNLIENDVLVNLASQEYAKVLDFKNLGFRKITPNFKEFNSGNYKMVMMYAKNARGKMARYIIENDIKDDEDLKCFQVDGYTFDEKKSSHSEWLFVR